MFIYGSVKVKYSLTFAVTEALTSPSAVQGCIVLDTAQIRAVHQGRIIYILSKLKREKLRGVPRGGMLCQVLCNQLWCKNPFSWVPPQCGRHLVRNLLNAQELCCSWSDSGWHLPPPGWDLALGQLVFTIPVALKRLRQSISQQLLDSSRLWHTYSAVFQRFPSQILCRRVALAVFLTEILES